MVGELHRDVAFEAVLRGARVNPHEMWGLLERLEHLSPKVLVDVQPDPAAWWAWWSVCPRVIGVSTAYVHPSPAFSTPHLPESVVNLVGDPRDPATVLRVRDQAAGPVDVVVLGGPFAEAEFRDCFRVYASMVRDGGVVVVQGIADRAASGAAQFWAGPQGPGHCQELIGENSPIGYGVVEIHGRDRANG